MTEDHDMSANPVFHPDQLSDSSLSERVMQLAMSGDTDSFEWHCLDQELQRRLADDYVDRSIPAAPGGRFLPVLVGDVE